MSEYYRRALRQMDLERSEKTRIAEEKRRALYQAHPHLDGLEARIAAVTREAFSAMRQEGADVNHLARQTQEKIDSLRLAHERELQKLGIDPASLLAQYDCPHCADSGYIDAPDGTRRICECLKKRAAAMALIDEDYLPDPSLNFAAFDLGVFPDKPDPVENEKHSQRELMRLVCALSHQYAQDFRAKGAPNLIFGGASGLGKTFLCHCVANEVQARGFTVCFLTAYRLSALLKSVYFGDDEAQDMEKALIRCDLLVIDDLGSEPIRRNIHLEGLFCVLNERAAAHRATLTATNLTLLQLRDRYGERITSRLCDGQSRVVRLYGADVRRTGGITNG